jgi:hypothetical protein
MENMEGKTYTLRSGESGSDDYYSGIRALADELLSGGAAIPELLGRVRRAARNRRRLSRLLSREPDSSPDGTLAHRLRNELSGYTKNTNSHLSGLSIRERLNRTLSTSEAQYHFSMLEIELVNRANVTEFRACDVRLAFLPHCLHDLNADCRSALRGEDYMCRGCSRGCTLNAVSKLLRRHGVVPYIWMSANLGSLFRTLRRKGKTVGILGIACIPELVNGMRTCGRARVPVVGVPLDANRCARWWGEFRPNSVNLSELEKVLGEETLVRPLVRYDRGPGDRRERHS